MADDIAALLAASLARRSVLNAVGDGLNLSEIDARCRRATVTEQHILMTPTPHGSVLQEVRAPRNDGSEFPMLLCRPKALLWLAVRMSPAFEEFVRTTLPGHTSRVTVYMDDVRPGNQLRHDHGWTYCAWYWTMLELPA